MITERDLQEAIAECQGQRNPNANTCIKLAAFLTIRRELFPVQAQQEEKESRLYSFDRGEEIIGSYGKSDFLTAINGKSDSEIWPIMDELMESMRVLQPRIYDSVMRKIQNV